MFPADTDKLMTNFMFHNNLSYITMKDGLFYLYHWHLPDDPDTTKGYIGITDCPLERYYAHFANMNKTAKQNHPLYRQMRTGDIQFTVLWGSESPVEIASLERAYRPRRNMGWNIAAGGSYGQYSAHPPLTAFLKMHLDLPD